MLRFVLAEKYDVSVKLTMTNTEQCTVFNVLSYLDIAAGFLMDSDYMQYRRTKKYLKQVQGIIEKYFL